MKNFRRYFVVLLILFLITTSATHRSSATGTLDFVNESLSCETGYASYYSYECADQPMANGKMFDPEARTCASWFYCLGTVLTVKSLDTGLSTEVIVTDRGPNRRLVKKGRIIDLSKRSFQDICDLEKGLTGVMVAVKK